MNATTSATQTPPLGDDDSIFVVYDRDRMGRGEILGARITEADILAGHITTPGSRVSIPINCLTRNR